MTSGKVWKTEDAIDSDQLAEIHEDKYPVTEGHLLFIPKNNFFPDSALSLSHCFSWALLYGRHKVNTGKWEAFNIGFNWGEAAGQTVAWPHVHLIPRRKGDMEDPRGGVRGVIPEKQKY